MTDNLIKKMYAMNPDGENWNSSLRQLVLDHNSDRMEGNEIDTSESYYEYDCVENSPSDFIDLNCVEERMIESAQDEFSCDANDYLHFKRDRPELEMRMEFNKKIKALADEYFECRLLSVEGVVKKQFTTLDLTKRKGEK